MYMYISPHTPDGPHDGPLPFADGGGHAFSLTHSQAAAGLEPGHTVKETQHSPPTLPPSHVIVYAYVSGFLRFFFSLSPRKI